MPRSASENPNRSPTLSSLVTSTQLVPRLTTAPTTNATTARPIPTGLRTPRHRPAGAPTKREGRTDDGRPRSSRRLLPRTDNAPTRLPGSPSQILDAQRRIATQLRKIRHPVPTTATDADKLSSAKACGPTFTGLFGAVREMGRCGYNVTATPDEVPRTSLMVGKVCAVQSEYRRAVVNGRNDQIDLFDPKVPGSSPGRPATSHRDEIIRTTPSTVAPTGPRTVYWMRSGAMPTIGLASALPPIDPWKGALPNAKIPPSEATSQ